MIVGLKKKSSNCKICTAFDDEVLKQITYDILSRKKTWIKICKEYTPLLPDGVKPLNEVNINSHRKHCDPSLYAQYLLATSGELFSEGDLISQLYAERFKKEIDKKRVLKEVYRERINNLHSLDKILRRKKNQCEKLLFNDDAISKNKVTVLEREIVSLIKTIDTMHGDLQNVLIRETSVDKGIGEGSNVSIHQTFVVNLQDHLKGYLEEIIPYLMMDVFGKTPDLGKKVINYITRSMDKHLTPALQNAKLLSESQGRPS
jgi:hypothetical protein